MRWHKNALVILFISLILFTSGILILNDSLSSNNLLTGAAVANPDNPQVKVAACQDITTTTTLTADITATGNCFNVIGNNIVIDGAGYGVSGDNTGSAFIINDSTTTVVIKNLLNISQFESAIEVNGIKNNLTAENIYFFNNTVAINTTNTTNLQILENNFTINNKSFLLENTNASFFYKNNIYNNSIGFENDQTNNNTYQENNLTENVEFGIKIANGNDTKMINNTFFENIEGGITLGLGTNHTYLLNNNLTINVHNITIEDQDTKGTVIITYNNSFGNINWTVLNATIRNETIALKDTIFLNSNSIGIANKSGLKQLNTTANITFYSPEYNYQPFILKDGIRSDNTSSTNITSYENSTNTLKFNVQGFSTYETQENIPPGFLIAISNTTSTSNLTLDNVSCFINLEDNQTTNLTIYWELYNSTVLINSGAKNVTNNTLHELINVSSMLTSYNDNYTCGFKSSDNITNSSWINHTIDIKQCGDINQSYTWNENIQTGPQHCYDIQTDNLTLDLNGYNITGVKSKRGFTLTDINNITILNGSIINFSDGILGDNLSKSNITWINFSTNVEGIYFVDSTNNSIFHNEFTDTTAIRFVTSGNNTIINNILNASANNAISTLRVNSWNGSYACSDSYSNIIGGNCSGGNYWNNYSGRDNGGGIAYPSTVSNDFIGDTQLPWDNDDDITPTSQGDILPLMLCNEFWTCTSWSGCNGQTNTRIRNCVDNNACVTLFNKPATSQTCFVGGGSSSGTSSPSSSDSPLPPKESLPPKPPKQSTTLPPKDSTQTQESLPPKNLILNIQNLGYDQELKKQILRIESGESLPPPTKDMFKDIQKIKENLKISTTKTIPSSTTSLEDSQEDSSTQNSLDKTTTKTISKIQNKQDAIATAKQTKQTITFKLENTGDKEMQLKPILQTPKEETKLIVTRKQLSNEKIKKGLKTSKTTIEGDLLAANLANADIINLKPGEKLDLDLDILSGFSTENSIPIKIELAAYDGTILEQEINIKNIPTIASAVIPDTTKNTLDLYSMIINNKESEKEDGKEENNENKDEEATESNSDSTASNSITGNLIGSTDQNKVFEFISNDDYYLEINIIKESEKSTLSKIPIIGRFFPSQKTYFSELYGPYPVESEEGFIFAQQFEYNPEIYTEGTYNINMKILQGTTVISENEFETYLGPEENQETSETIESN